MFAEPPKTSMGKIQKLNLLEMDKGAWRRHLASINQRYHAEDIFNSSEMRSEEALKQLKFGIKKV